MITPTANFFSTEYQLQRLNQEVAEYSQKTSEAIARIQEALLNSVTPQQEGTRPMTPPVLRVESASLTLVPKGEFLLGEIQRIKKYLDDLGMSKDIEKPFADMNAAVQNSHTTLLSVIDSFRKERAPANALRDQWPIGIGYSREYYMRQVYEVLNPSADLCTFPDDFEVKRSGKSVKKSGE